MTGSSNSIGGTQALFNPEWDYDRQDEKIESVHRTKGGNQFRYLWGSFRKVKFNISQIDSATAAKINGWWLANTPVVLYNTSSVAVCSGYIVNKKMPVGKFVMPYSDQFAGSIELESF